MCATFTDDDVGKPVERADGKVIGTVASLEDGRARVEPAPDVVDTIKVRFGWAEIGDPFVLDESDVSEISEGRIHLEEEFSRGNARTTASESATGEPADRPDDGRDHDGSGPVSDAAGSNRSDGGVGPATGSAAHSSGVGPFDGPFQIGAAAVSALFFLVALLFAWTGFQGSILPLVGMELSIVSGAAGLMMFAFFSVIAFVIAVYMEPGFDH